MNSNARTKPITRRTSKVKVTVAALFAVIVSVVGFAAPAAAAAAQTYHSTPVNGMWHSGVTQYYNGNTQFNLTVNFNDAAGDAHCTQLRVRGYQSNGAWTLFTLGTVCGGRSGTLSHTMTAYTGTRLSLVEIWTVRVDGGARSYVWSFRP